MMSRKILLFISVPFCVISLFLILSFRFPDISISSLSTSALPSDSNITLNLGEKRLTKLKVQEAFMMVEEQTDKVFAKVLNLSLVDRNGNMVALTLTDFNENKKSICLNTSSYFGNEHVDANRNSSLNVDDATFTNNSMLILELKDGSSEMSRNGWINISKCQEGKIWGSFEFEIQYSNESIISSGEFTGLKFELE